MKDPYSPVYMTCIDEAKKDLRAKARPELISMPASIEEYDTVILAYKDVAGSATGVVPGTVCCSGIYIDEEQGKWMINRNQKSILMAIRAHF